MSNTTVTGLSPELVAAKAELAAIERKRDQGRYGHDVFAIQADLNAVVAAALVSIATSLETRPI